MLFPWLYYKRMTSIFLCSIAVLACKLWWSKQTTMLERPCAKELKTAFSRQQVRNWGLYSNNQWGTDPAKNNVSDLGSRPFSSRVLTWWQPQQTRWLQPVRDSEAQDLVKLCSNCWLKKLSMNCFEPLNFGVVSYAGIGNSWNPYYYMESLFTWCFTIFKKLSQTLSFDFS